MVDINPQIIEAEIAQIGPQGIPGQAATITIGSVTTGAAGSSATVTNSGTSIAAVLDFVIPQGAKGAQGEQGQQGIQGLTGATGNGISSIAKIGTSGLVDTYRITLTDNTYYDFTVTNGSSISDIEKTGTSGLVDTYTITLTNGNTHTFTVTNGAEGEKGETGDVGNGILNILKMSTTGLVDNYRINFTNGTYFDFDVTNALSIQSIAKLSTSGLVDTYRITFNDSTYFDFPVTNGRGVTGVTLLSWEGLDKTYRMSFNDGTYFDYVVTNGTGQVDWGGISGILSQQADLQEALDSKANMSQTHALKGYSDNGELLYDAEGLEDVKNYAHSTFDASKFTKVGSPVITDDGIASGFSRDNYITVSTNIDNTASKVEVFFEIDAETATVTNHDVVLSQSLTNHPIQLNTNNNTCKFGMYTTSWTLGNTLYNANDKIQGKFEYNITTQKCTLYSRLKGATNWIEEISFTSATNPIGGTFYLGRNATNGNEYYGSNHDLKQFSVTVDGVPVFSGNKTGIDIVKDNDYTVVGTPTISADGVASGFSASDYLTLPNVDFTKPFSIKISFSKPSSASTFQGLWSYGNSYIDINDATFRLYLNLQTSGIKYDNQSVSTSALNNAYIIFSWDESVYSAKLYNSNGELLKTASYTSSETMVVGTQQLGYKYNAWQGSIDLNSFKIYVDGNLVYQPCLRIPYTESSVNSGRIVNFIYRDRVLDAYNQYGSYNSYTLQENNVPNYTVVGSPTISSDYVASGFGNNNYITTPTIDRSKPFVQFMEFETPASLTNYSGGLWVEDTSTIYRSRIQLNAGGILKLFLTSAGSSFDICETVSTIALSANTKYYAKFSWTGSKYKVEISTDKVTFTTHIEVDSSSTLRSLPIFIGKQGADGFTGSIDLKEFEISTNNKLAYQAVIPPNFTLPCGDVYGMIGLRTLVDSHWYSDGSYWELWSDRTLEIGGTCESGVEYNLPRPFASNVYLNTIPCSAKTASSFTPSATGDFIAKGKGIL